MNRIIESSTSTGTGNFTLNGALVDPAQGLVGTLPFSARVPLKLYVPYMIEDASGNWEKGKGFLQDATTFVRGYVLDNSLNNTTKIDFPAGSKKVFFPTENRAFGADYFNNSVWKNTPSNIGFRSAVTLPVNTLVMTPHLQLTSQRITAVGIKVTSAAAGSRIKIALYNFVRQADGNDFNSAFPIAFEIGEVSGATATEKIINTDFYLPEGAYMIGVVSDSAVGLTGNSTTNNSNTLFWENLCGDTTCRMEQSGVSVDAMPATTSGTMTRRTNQATVCVGFRGVCL